MYVFTYLRSRNIYVSFLPRYVSLLVMSTTAYCLALITHILCAFFVYFATSMNRISKSSQELSYDQFFATIGQVKAFACATGQRYQVLAITGDEITIKVVGNIRSRVIDLRKLYTAFSTLQNFQLSHFKAFLPDSHFAARSLLIHAGLLKHG